MLVLISSLGLTIIGILRQKNRMDDNCISFLDIDQTVKRLMGCDVLYNNFFVRYL